MLKLLDLCMKWVLLWVRGLLWFCGCLLHCIWFVLCFWFREVQHFLDFYWD